jgi:hypothetical protein
VKARQTGPLSQTADKLGCADGDDAHLEIGLGDLFPSSYAAILHFAIPTSTFSSDTAYAPKKHPASSICASQLGYGACMGYGIARLWCPSMTGSFVSLWALLYYRLSPLPSPSPTLREPLCSLQGLIHGMSGLPTTFPRTPAHRLRQRYYPLPLRSLCNVWPSSWRGRPRGAPCSVAQRPGQLASCGLTCRRRFLI